jgi:hypothetical protein
MTYPYTNKMEDWKSIDGFDGYFVSSFGNIKSVKPKPYGVRILKPADNKGYSAVALYRKDRKVKRFFIHRLVAMAFIDNPKNKPFINHINANPKDNRVENLEWCTQVENINHAYKLGNKTKPVGEANHCSKLKEWQVLEIRSLIGKEPFKEIAERFGVSTNLISAINTKRKWRHI